MVRYGKAGIDPADQFGGLLNIQISPQAIDTDQRRFR
jgi:hypothetical protein